MIYELAGYLSGIAALASYTPYIRDIFLKKTKPERASYSLILAGVQAFGNLFIFILAIKYGIGGLLRRDKIVLVSAVVSLFLWYITKEAATALFLVIFINAAGTVLTIIKSYEYPATETTSTWLFIFLSGFLACIAVGNFNFILLAFPFYIFLAGLGVLIAIKLGSKRVKLPV